MTKNLVNVGRIFLAIMFLFSGISKLLSLPFFDGMVAELFLGENYYDSPGNMLYTQILSRLLISIELVLGIAVLQNKWLKKATLPGILLMLLVFTVHLFYEGLTSDKGFIEGNCGCFGDVLPMNNLESIIKNVVAMVVGVFVWWKYKDDQKLSGVVAPILLGVITMGTLLFSVKQYEVRDTTDDVAHSFVDTFGVPELVDTVSTEVDTIVNLDTTSIDSVQAVKEVPEKQVVRQPPPAKTSTRGMLEALGRLSDGSRLNLGTGEHLVCLFSMTCGHCQESYAEMCELSKQGKFPRTYLVNYGKEFEQTYFFLQGGECYFPHYRTENYTQFNRLLQGKGFPRMIAFKNGKIVKEWDIDSYNKEAFMSYYGIKEKKDEGDGLIIKKKDDDFDEFEKEPWE